MNPDSAFRPLRGFPRLDSDAIIAVLTRGIQGGVMAAGAAAEIWRMTPVDHRFPPADWHRDVWPFQWRVGVSAIAGYLVFQAFSPIFLTLQVRPRPAASHCRCPSRMRW